VEAIFYPTDLPDKEPQSDDIRTKNQQALKAKLKGSTLGSDKADDSMSTAKWIKKQKKQAKEREREMLAKRAREMEEQDQAVYDERTYHSISLHRCGAFKADV
jgi:U4/U6.U5 tri-snRNP-associated protein 1